MQYLYHLDHGWGAHWTPPFQVNENQGKVVDTYKSSSLWHPFLIWEEWHQDIDLYMDKITMPPATPTIQGRNSGTIDKLYELKEVKEIYSVHGDVDFIVKVELTRDLLSSDAEIISQFVHEKVRLIPGINNTNTLIPGFSRIKKPEVELNNSGESKQ